MLYICFPACSCGIFRGLFADTGSFQEWRDAVDQGVADEAQQDGHVDSCAAQGTFPAHAQLMNIGDGRQQPHIGNPSKQGSRKASAHLEAAKATLRGNVRAMPMEAILGIFMEAAVNELEPSQRGHNGPSHDPLLLFKALRSLLRSHEGVETLQRFLNLRFPKQELSLLLTRSYRLPYPTYMFYLIAEMYYKALMTMMPLMIPAKHPARAKGWRAIDIGHVSSAQAVRAPLRDPYGSRLKDFHLVHIDVQPLREAGVKLVATPDGSYHPYLDIMTRALLPIILWDLARNAQRITAGHKYTILTTHNKLRERLQKALHGPKDRSNHSWNKGKSGEDQAFCAEEDRPDGQQPAEWHDQSLWEFLAQEVPDDIEAIRKINQPALGLLDLISDRLSGGLLGPILQRVLEVKAAQTATGETKGCTFFAGWVNNVFACKSFTTNVGISRGEHTTVVASVNLGSFSLIRRLVNVSKAANDYLPGTYLWLTTRGLQPDAKGLASELELGRQAHANCRAMLENTIYSNFSWRRNQYLDQNHPISDILTFQEAINFLFQTKRMMGWTQQPMGIALQFKDGQNNTSIEKIYVRDYIQANGKELMVFTRAEYLSNDVFQHSDYARLRNQDWMLRIQNYEDGVSITAKHIRHGRLQWWLAHPDEACALAHRWRTEEGEFSIKIALPAPADALQMEISPATNPFVGEDREYATIYWHYQEDKAEEGDIEVSEQEEQDLGDMDDAAFTCSRTLLLEDKTQIQAYANYQMVCKALMCYNSEYQPCNGAVVNSIKDLKVGEPLIIDLNISWLFEELRQMYLIPHIHELMQTYCANEAEYSKNHPNGFTPDLKLVQGVFETLSRLIFSVVERFDFGNAVRDRYNEEERKLAVGQAGTFADMAQLLKDKSTWDRQLLLAMNNCHKDDPQPSLVQIRRGGKNRKGNTIVGRGEMRLRLFMPAEGVAQFAEETVNSTLEDRMTGQVQFPVPGTPGGTTYFPKFTPMAPWKDQQRFPLMEEPGNIYPGGVVVGAIRDRDPTKRAHTGIGLVTARAPIDSDTYDTCIRALAKILDPQYTSHTAQNLLLRNEPWILSKIQFGQVNKDIQGRDDTASALHEGNLLGNAPVGDILAAAYNEKEWLREAFTFPASFLHGALSQMKLAPNQRKRPMPTPTDAPLFNRTTFEPMFKPSEAKGKKRNF